ncbi:glutathione-dependent formaldehyde-activating gfa [Colletotrichum truncatum]|uniref:Glutathione-dependent formaldehyde-activating gfa n=1 Tax=Colletotrichum truncatum TaxID=5467 RepID=A0ACC3ZL99_COLTU|nr:glutathione-dependent formaldehyde-activating gfa [Colletotrichum truncatum]KAF6800098.1 glutathione-dependent formaldehyde-activating gfa [Colletotrichum truncatum]
MAESLTMYQGNCHCGINRFEVELPEQLHLVSCYCALCTKKGYVWIYDAERNTKITKGCNTETLTSYTSSGTDALQHEFCSNCGTGLFGTHTSGVQAGKRGISLRPLISNMTGVFLRGKEVISLDPEGNPTPYLGRLSLIKPSTASTSPTPEFRGMQPKVTEEHLRLYQGACDCGAVQVALKIKPLAEVEVKEDNCSICVRNGFIGVYPHQSQVTLVGKENTQDYRFGRRFNGSPFCKTCGVHCFSNLYGPPQAIIDRLPDEKKKFVRRQLEIQPVNVGVLEDVEWDKLNLQWANEGTEGYVLQD